MDTKMRCKCGNCVPVKEMKYDINGTDLICGECYRYQQLRFKEKVFGKSYNKIETITGKKRDTVDTRRFQEEKIIQESRRLGFKNIYSSKNIDSVKKIINIIVRG